MLMVPPCSSGQLAFLQPLLGSRKAWRTVTGSFFPHLVEFLQNCCHIFLVQRFSFWNLWSSLMAFLYFVQEARYRSIFVLRISQAYMRCLLSFHQWLTSLLSFPASNLSSAQLSNIDLLSFYLLCNSVVLIWTSYSENFTILLVKRKFFPSFKKQINNHTNKTKHL